MQRKEILRFNWIFPREVQWLVLSQLDCVEVFNLLVLGVVDLPMFAHFFKKIFCRLVEEFCSLGSDYIFIEDFLRQNHQIKFIFSSMMYMSSRILVNDIKISNNEGYCYMTPFLDMINSTGSLDLKFLSGLIFRILGPNPNAILALSAIRSVLNDKQCYNYSISKRISKKYHVEGSNLNNIPMIQFACRSDFLLGAGISSGFSMIEEKSILRNFLSNLDKGDSLAAARNDISSLDRWTLTRHGASAVKSFIDSKLIEIAKTYRSKQKKKLTRGQRDLLDYVEGSKLSIGSMESLSVPPPTDSRASLVDSVLSSVRTINKGKSTVYLSFSNNTSQVSIDTNAYNFKSPKDIIISCEKALLDLELLEKESQIVDKVGVIAARCEEEYERVMIDGKLTTDMRDIGKFIDFLEKERKLVLDDEVMSLSGLEKILTEDNTISVKNSISSLKDEYMKPYPKDEIIRDRLHLAIVEMENNHNLILNKIMSSNVKYDKPAIPRKPSHLKSKLENKIITNSSRSDKSFQSHGSRQHMLAGPSNNITSTEENTVMKMEPEIEIEEDKVIIESGSNSEEIKKDNLPEVLSTRDPNTIEQTPFYLDIKGKKSEYRRDSGVEISNNEKEIMETTETLESEGKDIDDDYDIMHWIRCDFLLRKYFNIPIGHNLETRYGSRTSWEYFIFCHSRLSKFFCWHNTYKYKTDMKKIKSLKRVLYKFINESLRGKNIVVPFQDDIESRLKCFLRGSFKHVHDKEYTSNTATEPLKKYEEVLDEDEMVREFNMLIESQNRDADWNSMAVDENIEIQKRIDLLADKINKTRDSENYINPIKKVFMDISISSRQTEINELNKSKLKLRPIYKLNRNDMIKRYKQVETAEYQEYKRLSSLSMKDRYKEGYCKPLLAPSPREIMNIINSNLSSDLDMERIIYLNLDERGDVRYGGEDGIQCYVTMRGFCTISSLSMAINNYLQRVTSSEVSQRITTYTLLDEYFAFNCFQSVISFNYISSKIFFTRKAHRETIIHAINNLMGITKEKSKNTIYRV